MSKFKITDGFWGIFPDAEISVILAKSIDSSEKGNEAVRPEMLKALKDANNNSKKYLTKEIFSENKVIAVWREAFQKFKTKKGARCSIEALLKRVDKGNEIGAIIPLVDVYNTVSLDYGIPCGGEDVDSLRGNMLLTIADGGESFKPLGADKPDEALPGEVIYKDDEGAVCRCWNWREGERTMLTEDTKNAFLIIESVDPERHDDFVAATEELDGLVKKYFGCETEVSYLNTENREIELLL